MRRLELEMAMAGALLNVAAALIGLRRAWHALRDDPDEVPVDVGTVETIVALARCRGRLAVDVGPAAGEEIGCGLLANHAGPCDFSWYHEPWIADARAAHPSSLPAADDDASPSSTSDASPGPGDDG